MTTRLTRTQKTKRTPLITLHCPSCRSPQRCKPVGTAVVNGVRREVMECSQSSCSLQWVPTRASVPVAA